MPARSEIEAPAGGPYFFFRRGGHVHHAPAPLSSASGRGKFLRTGMLSSSQARGRSHEFSGTVAQIAPSPALRGQRCGFQKAGPGPQPVFAGQGPHHLFQFVPASGPEDAGASAGA